MTPSAGASYTVRVHTFADHVRAETFAGADALARAQEFFAAATANPSAAEVRMTRTDPSGRVEFVRRLGRERPGARLVQMTDIVDPPG